VILDLDVGNSRMKWLLHRESQKRIESGERGVIDKEHAVAAIQELAGNGIKRVRVCSVVAGLSAELKASVRNLLGVEAEFAQVENGCDGLICGYQQPERLGIDRWMALLAGHRLHPGKFIVVDAGSALTVDLCDGDRHLGGYIAPGLGMQVTSLGLNTAGVLVDREVAPSLNAGCNTNEAVYNACLAAAVGVIEAGLHQLAADKIFFTGGDARRLSGFFANRSQVEVRPDMVMEGLAIACP
jgi:type III pantothenate kinase